MCGVPLIVPAVAWCYAYPGSIVNSPGVGLSMAYWPRAVKSVEVEFGADEAQGGDSHVVPEKENRSVANFLHRCDCFRSPPLTSQDSPP